MQKLIWNPVSRDKCEGKLDKDGELHLLSFPSPIPNPEKLQKRYFIKSILEPENKQTKSISIMDQKL